MGLRLTTIYFFCSLLFGNWDLFGAGKNLADPFSNLNQYTALDTFPLRDRKGDFITDETYNPFDITPSIITQEVEYDPETGQYIILEKIGEEYYRMPTYMNFQEYLDWKNRQQDKAYFSRLAGVSTPGDRLAEVLDPMAKIDVQDNLVDRLFGGTEVTIQPRGNIDLTFGVDYQKIQNPFIPPRLQRQGGFDFDMGIQMNVEGKIGEKMNLDFNYNTAATFDFDNKIKINYDSEQFSEDDIIKKIEAGDVSLPLRSQLIEGSQSLFGVKTELQFGKLRITGVASQQRSQQKDLVIENGSLIQEFEIRPDEYDENRHFFVSHYNKDKYEGALLNIPQVRSLFRITRIEVWVTNDQNSDLQNSTTVAAISYLGEPEIENYSDPNSLYPPKNPLPADLLDVDGNPLPDNTASELFSELVNDDVTRNIVNTSTRLKTVYGLQQVRDFEVQSMRRLNPNEFTYHPELGFISINIRLRPNQVLGIAYEYTYTLNGGKIYKVGEITNEASSGGVDQFGDPQPEDVIYVKMIKSSNQRIDLPSWDLMMKNVYPLGTSQLTQEDFQLDIFFEDNSDATLKRFLPEDGFRTIPLLDVFQLDRLNSAGDPQQDGIFDFVPGITVNVRTGSIFFPVLEPFGSSLLKLLDNNEQLYDKYGYPELYRNSITKARENLDQNRFLIKGKLKSSVSSDISLNAFNIPPGSVVVRAGSQILREGIDYDIDYGIGRIKILNDAFIQQGVPIRVSFEDQSLFSLQQKTMFGLRADYEANKNLNIGATYLRLFERPFTEKVNIGDDPINNRIFGFDINYSNESSLLTKIVDKIPFIDTKEKSFINFSAEVAALQPGHSGAINISEDDGGVVSIDDFEGAGSFVPLGSRTNLWQLASTPSSFLESGLTNDLANGYNRAKLNWYVIDDRSVRTDEDRRDSYTRIVNQQDLFDREIPLSQIPDLLTFDMSYYPDERGPYNFDPPEGSAYSAGLGFDQVEQCVKLKDPESRWGGIMRYLPNNDFEASNFEYIEFWMLNPFLDRRDGSSHDPGEQGYIYFNLGNVSEDVMKDNLQFYENSIPTPDETIPVEETVWGRVPLSIPQVQGFDQQNIELQDLGLDGLNDSGEMELFQEYVESIRTNFPGDTCVLNDPANDNFVSYLSEFSGPDENNLLRKYRRYNNPQGNAPDENSRIGTGNPIPDIEDMNDNRSLEQSESYYEYAIRLRNSNGEIERTSFDYITDEIVITNPSTSQQEKWYRFQIPIDKGTPINDIQGFRSIQFIRMFMTGFSSQKTFRLAEFELVRNQWRRLEVDCKVPNVDFTPEFVVDEVGIEENSNKDPFNYVSPKGIKQERLFNTFSNVLQDEKSLKLSVCQFRDSCEAKIYKLTQLDLRWFKKLQLFVHAEEVDKELNDGDLSAFIRIGKDFNNNYYEYEIPLVFSDKEAADAVRGDQELYSDEVWREENKFDFLLTEFTELKKIRNKEGYPIEEEFSSRELPESVFDPEKDNAIVSIKGNPSLGYVKGITIGLRNRSGIKDEALCAEVWVNELRMSGLEEDGGVAGLARLELQLADFGDLTMSGSYSSIGWGALDQKVFERNKERIIDYDIAANFNLGKFLPDDWNIRIPFYAQYAKSIVMNRYDQYELDLTVDEVLEQATDPDEIQDIKDRNAETTTIKTINFTNVKKERSGSTGSPKPWDIENFSVSYSYTQTEYKDALIEKDVAKDYRGSLDYNYSRSAKYIEPFKGIKGSALKIISEFNFNPIPNAFSFSTQLRRFKSDKLYRIPDDIDFAFNDQRFDWDRRYTLQWDLTRALNLSFNANNYAVIDELRQVGIRQQAEDRPWVDEMGSDEDEVTGRSYSSLVLEDPGYTRKYAWDNIRDFGRTKNYDHSLSLNYTLPIRYLPFMDWITMRAQYNANYSWSGASLNTLNLGNVIQNNQNRSLNATFDFTKLYAKSGYLNKLDKGQAASRPQRSRSRGRTGDQNDQANQDRRSSQSERPISFIEKLLLRPLLAIRNFKFTYKEDFTTVVPGFKPMPKYFGLGEAWSSPGLGFVFGSQPDFSPDNPDNWLLNAAENNWITTDRFQNQQVLQNNTQNYEAKFELEPWKDLRIDINFKKTYIENHSEDFINTSTNPDNPTFEQLTLRDIGSFDVTYFALNTLFDNDINGLFNEFEESRADISKRLPNNSNASHDKDGALYAKGYGKLQNDVVIHSFLAAYTGNDAETATMDIQNDIRSRSYIPKPNWTLRYNGLSKLPFFRDIFSSFSINHAYRANLRVSSFETDLQYDRNNPYFIDPNISQANYFSRFEIPSVMIVEQFVPIIGIDLKTTNDLNMNFEYRKTRNLSLLTGNISQLTEARTTEFTFGFGWTLTNVNIGFITGDKGSNRNRGDQGNPDPDDPQNQGNRRVTNSRGKEMTINLDFSFRDDVTWIHEIDKGASAEPIRGLKTLRINPSVDYDVNENLTLRMFVDFSKTKPYLSTSYPITSIQGGLTARFNLN